MTMKRNKILLVEDDATLSFLIEVAQIIEGFDVLCAANSEAGIKLFNAANP